MIPPPSISEVLQKVRELVQVAKEGARSEDNEECFANGIKIMAHFPFIAQAFEKMYHDNIELRNRLSKYE
jgi:hypothetical protein